MIIEHLTGMGEKVPGSLRVAEYSKRKERKKTEGQVSLHQMSTAFRHSSRLGSIGGSQISARNLLFFLTFGFTGETECFLELSTKYISTSNPPNSSSVEVRTLTRILTILHNPLGPSWISWPFKGQCYASDSNRMSRSVWEGVSGL